MKLLLSVFFGFTFIAFYSQNFQLNSVNFRVSVLEMTDEIGNQINTEYSALNPSGYELVNVINTLDKYKVTKNDVFQLIFYEDTVGKKVIVNHLIFKRKSQAKKNFAGWQDTFQFGLGVFYERYMKIYLFSGIENKNIKVEVW